MIRLVQLPSDKGPVWVNPRKVAVLSPVQDASGITLILVGAQTWFSIKLLPEEILNYFKEPAKEEKVSVEIVPNKNEIVKTKKEGKKNEKRKKV